MQPVALPMLEHAPVLESGPAGPCWNLFAFPVRLGGGRYALLTDDRSVVAIDAATFDDLREAHGRPVPPELDGDALERLVAAGVVRMEPPAEQFARVFARKQEEPREYELLHIITSYKCNLTCSYCFMLSDLDRHPTKSLGWEDAKQGIDLFFSRPHKPDSVVHFYGGEPLLHPQLIEDTLEYIHAHYSTEVLPKIITNGTLHRDRHLELLARYPFDLSVSMDGDREAHDVFRLDHGGRSTFDATVEGVRRFQEIGHNPKILITVGQHNIARLPEIVDFVLSLGPAAIALNFPRELPVSDSGLDELEADTAFWVDQYERSVELCYERNIPELYLADMLFAFLSGEPVLSPCAACGTQMSIGPGAQLGPCQAFVAAGMFSQPAAEFTDGDSNPAFGDWQGVSKASSAKCSRCSISAICGGDCSFDRYNRLQSLHEPLPFHCDMRLRMAEILTRRLVGGLPLGFAATG